MIPDRIVRYLQRRLVPFARRWHTRAVSAQDLAESMHVSGFRVAKTVAVEVDGRLWIAVIPAPARVDLDLVREALGANEVHLAREEEFAGRFPDCEVGAEPPFGQLYGLPVVLDQALDQEEPLLMRAGSHEETIELSFDSLRALETPIVASISRVPEMPSLERQDEARMRSTVPASDLERHAP